MALALYYSMDEQKPAPLILGYLGGNEHGFLNKLIGRLQIQVRALARDIALCSWARQFILTQVTLLPGVHMFSGKFNAGGNPTID